MKKKELTQKIIRSEFEQFILDLPNPSDILSSRKGAIETYCEMLLDEKIASLWETRKNRILDLHPIVASTGNEQVDEFCKKHIEDKFIRKLSAHLIDALIYGHRPVDITWKEENGIYYPSECGAANISRFSYKGNGELQIETNGTKMEANQPYRWLVHRKDGSRRDNPWGTSIFNKIFWVWSFKKLGLEFWLQMEKKFAVPSIFALFESEESNPDRLREVADSITKAISEVVGGSSGTLANVKEITQLKAEGSVADFKVLCDYCNEAISVGLTSQILSTGTTENGNRALGEVHEETLNSLIKNDAMALAYTIQQIYDWFVELNFGKGVITPSFSFDIEDKASLEEVMMAIDRGVPVSKKALYERYKIPMPEDDDDSFIKNPALPAMNFADSSKKKSKLILLNER